VAQRGFFGELKRRHVIRVAGVYLVAAWLITQVAGTVFPMFGAPGWMAPSVVVLLAIGLIPALVVAWVYELTSEGWRRDAVTNPEGQIAPPPATRTWQDINRKSIAVLPFENLSEDKANAYFVEGINDEILTRLAKISALKVCSRTSTRQYVARPGNLAEIALRLGVANILEGSVQRSAGTVRVNVQLIEADSDSHLWAESYDRDMDDIFSVESEVAQAVADALKATLLPAETVRIASVPTTDPDAYDRFLKAQHLTRQIVSTSVKDPADIARKAVCLYESAIEADPAFALAHAQLAHLKSYLYWNDIDFSPQTINAAQIAATQALALQPNLPEAHLAMGYVRYWGRRDYAGALAEFAIARESLPNDANVIAAIAFVHRRQGDLAQAITELEKAAELDPHDSSLTRDLGDTYLYLRRYSEAVAAFDRSLALAPDNIETHIYRAGALRMCGDAERSRRALAAIPEGYDPQGSVSLARFNLALAMRQPGMALAAIAQAPAWLLDNVNNVLVPAALLRGRALARTGATGPAQEAFLAAQGALEEQLREAPEHAGIHGNLAIVHAGLGHKDAALAAACRATDLLPVSRDILDGTFHLAGLAKIEAQVGETRLAVNHIEQLLAAPAGHEVSVASLRADPAWDPLRKDPRFRKLLKTADAAAGIRPMSRSLALLAELERRNIFRMGGLYLIGGCLIVQVVATLLPVFAAPAGVMQALIATLAIGTVPVLVFSWVFALTPDGLRRDAEVHPSASIARQTALRLNRMIVAVLLLALAYFGVDKYVLAPQRDAAPQVAASTYSGIPAKSIAVLPLVNGSGDKDQLYFSDGLSEDLITALSQFDGLKVIGRNSAFQFRDSKEDARAIGAKLGVAHLLEGSVRRVGDTVRITAQLIETADSSTVWSQRYDRPFKDLFALQDEITNAVASALKARLLTDAGAVVQSDRPPSGNLAAYGAYLEGNACVARGTEDELRHAVDAYTRATQFDPGYAQAWAGLSDAWSSLAARFLDAADMADGYARARAAVDTALALDANLTAAHLARGKLLLFADFDWTGGEAEYRRALELAPNNGSAKASLAEAVATLGHPDQAVELMREALASDALNARKHHVLATYLMSIDRLDEAVKALQSAIRLQPSAMGNREQLAIIEILRGNADAAVRYAMQEPAGDWRDAALARAQQIGADPAVANAALKTLIDRQADKAAYQIAQVHALRNDPDKVFEWLDRAWANRDAGISLLLYDPILLRYRDDPRYAVFTYKVGLPAPAAIATPAPVAKST
jgi:TolB-like protein/Tfp pilus assembly protein PilF